MFGFQGGESKDVVTRKRGYMKSAQEKWGFLTNYDLSTIKNKSQLATMVKIRSSISEAQATSDVASWADGKAF